MRLGDAATQLMSDAVGLYRVCDPYLPGLVYVVEGYIRARLANHLGKGSKATHRQGPFFRAGLECSWTINAVWLRISDWN